MRGRDQMGASPWRDDVAARDGLELRAGSAVEDQRGWVLAVYCLYLAAAFTFGSVAILGVFIAYLKRGEATGTIWRSHFDNQIRTFWISLILFIIAFPLSLILIGWLVWGVMLMYYIWKSAKGTIRAIDRRPYA